MIELNVAEKNRVELLMRNLIASSRTNKLREGVMAQTRVEIAMRHITEQQRKIKEHEARIEALLQAGHLTPLEIEFEEKLLRRLKAFERYLEPTD
jgi:hypothetical protein